MKTTNAKEVLIKQLPIGGDKLADDKRVSHDILS